MKRFAAVSFLLGQLLIGLVVFRAGLWGGAMLAPLDIVPTLFSKYHFMASNPSAVPANHYAIDQILADLPRQSTLYRAYRSGEMPWWDPYIYGGMPLVADGHNNGADPVRILLYLAAPFEKAYNWTLVAHFFLSGLGMFLLLRRFGFIGWSCALLALAYEFGGVFTLYFMNPWVLGAFVYYPYLWMAWDAAARCGNRWTWLPAGFLIAAVLSAGSVQTHSYLALFALAFAIGYGGFQWCEWKKFLPTISLSAVLGGCLAAPILLSQIELFFLSSRSVELVRGKLSWLGGLGSLTAIYPWCLGTFRTLDLGKVVGQNSLGFNLYIGSAAFVLAVAGTLFRPADQRLAQFRRTALILVGIYFAILSTPLLDIFYARCAPLAMMGITILAAMGVERLRSSDVKFARAGRSLLALTLVLAAATNFVAWVVYPRVQPRVEKFVEARDKSNKTLDSAPALRAFQVANLPKEVSFVNPETVLACAALAGVAWLLLQPAARQRNSIWVCLLCLNLAPVIWFSHRYISQQPMDLWRQLQDGGPEQKTVTAKLGGTPYRLWENAPGEHELLMPGSLSHLYQVRVAHGFSGLPPRGVLSLSPDERKTWDSRLADFTYTSTERGQRSGVFSASTTSDYARFEWLGSPTRRFAISDLSLKKIRVAFEPGLAGKLLWTDTYYPGWMATIDGHSATLNQTGPCFSEIEIPANARELILAFEPRFLPLGKKLALTGLLGSVGLLIVNLRRSRLANRTDKV